MPLFGTNQGSSLFSTVKSGLSSLFGGINRGAGGVSNLAGRAGSILNTISNIAKNPIVQTIAGGLGQGDNLAKFASATSQGANLAQKVGGISQKVADVTSPSTYFGQGAIPATKNAVERAKGIVGDTRNLFAGLPFMRGLGSDPATWSPFDGQGNRIRPLVGGYTPTQAIGQPRGLTVPMGMM